ncbi:MAG: class I SAM-dependent methyltransferase [Gemmatimonadota bacterium]|nr:class I SAM-dependent methyltransferase [Gemmatimonadota bacterium]MDH5760136.1 class I SAM-dependent methyltransferase [Gemmatimonadota bacterium]
MMSGAEEAFYDSIAECYEEFIPALVPQYRAYTDTLVELVKVEDPSQILDIGTGNGDMVARYLDGLPAARAEALEASPQMSKVARQRLARFGHRVRIVQDDVREFEPDRTADVITSSLVLHNVPPHERVMVLQNVRRWLSPGGVFVWGEFVRKHDARHEAAILEFRKKFALDAGCPSEVVEENFRKEAEDDFPPTVWEVLALGGATGFTSTDLVWAHDAFAIFLLRAGRAR